LRRVWRLCKAPYAAFDGEGARLFGGRWNLAGSAVVYASESLSLAALELLVHLGRDEDAPPDLVSRTADLPDDLESESVPVEGLPRTWRQSPPPEALARRGSEWLRRGRTAALRVPSAVIQHEWNVLLNPAHPEFPRIRLGRPEPFSYDPRLWK
jgi:RES domain-containing protein